MQRHWGSFDSRGWIIGLLVLGGVIAGLLMSQTPRKSTRITEPGRVSSFVEAPQSRLKAQTPGAGPRSAAPARVTCVEQYLELTRGDEPQRHCVSRTQVIQNGNVRTYRVESQGGAVRIARVDAAGEQILHAQVTMDSGEPFACGSGRCAGIGLGPYDSQGARAILFDNARLWRAAAGGETEEAVRVTGRLRTIPDDQLPASSCAGDVLLVSRGPGTLHFCPDSGSGYDLDEDGGTTFRFTNHDGTTLAVSVNASGALARVALGQQVCRAPRCGGVTLGAADADGRRRFSFRGTSLLESDADANVAVLNGVVVLAPL